MKCVKCDIKKILTVLVAFGMIFPLVSCTAEIEETTAETEESISATLIVDVEAYGWTEDGTDLSDNWSDALTVNIGDSVYQTSYDGHYATEEPESSAGVVFTIESISEDAVTIELADEEREIEFGESVEIESLVNCYDGQNYSFTIHFEEME